ncbi:uncharacterized protein LOC126767620 [Bactrocera neohumeralis]|uniref:uncharacterized protein LOC126767620 n=1 Tax=Bactrocera neohumeralis TaxID=98809 RepID=UPI0021658D28|nr:uncharacterized protein LOC126767620 [Bactrocera neohumeralis]
MFWLCSVSLSLFDYRLIAINALIYDLIATEIANANAHIVIAANVMTEFDKSAARAATTPETKTIPPTGAEQQRVAHEMSIKGKATTMKIPTTNTISTNNNTADVAFFGQKLSDYSDDDEISTNNSNSNNKSKMTRGTNGANNNTALQVALPASANVPFVSIAAARPLAMSAHNGTHANNKATVMPTINERVDNFRNDKKETNVWTTTTAAAAAVKVERSMVAPIGTTKTTTSATSNAATLAISKRPAIKSTAMHLTTSALATASVMTVKTTVQATTAATPAATTNAQAAKSAIEHAATAEAHETRSKWATALATTTTTTPTTTVRIIHATAAWPTLRSHDLLSSTNGMPNCRNATCVCVRTEKSHAATNINTATAATTTTTPIAPTTRVPITTAMASATTLLRTSTTVANTTLQTTKAATPVRHAAATTANKGGASAAYAAGAAGSTTGEVAATPMRSLMPCPTYSSPATPAAPAMSTTTTATAIHTADITDSAAGKSTAGPLQTQWQRILSRRKRYLAFPEGTSFTTSVCITIGIIGNPNYSYMSFGLNFGIGYDLPNATWVLNQLHGLSRRPLPMAVHHRRSKRAIYERIAEAVNNMGYSGRDCVLRALCESRQYFSRTKMGMIGEILRVIFSLPKQRIFSRELREDADIAAYDHAYRKADSQDCVAQYDCPFSLLELAFGRYSTPSDDFYGESGM